MASGSELPVSETLPTEAAPSVPDVLPTPSLQKTWVPALAPGQRIDDYEILRLLGAGGFARVYLARQISLDRLVALKVSQNEGSEARTLARLEHQHIVQIFAEMVDAERNLRLLCMQYVPGVTLAQVIACLAERPTGLRNGRTYLAILDELCCEPTPFDLGGLAIRGLLETCDHAELTCWIGARLAEALAHAHSQGVIHRDVKPANVLVNRYGRPLLADFNIAHSPGCRQSLGGTLAHMAPEHLDAFNPMTGTPPEVVDARSDLYSLSVVLFEILTGRLPFQRRLDSQNVYESLRELTAERRTQAPSPRTLNPQTPELLDRLVRRCLDPEPAQRFAGAADFMRALDGCRALLPLTRTAAARQQAMRAYLLPVRMVTGLRRLPQLLGRWSCAAPFLMLPLLALLPHLLGSIVNIMYNAHILADNNDEQQDCFRQLVLGYNCLAYPLLVCAFIIVILHVRRGWQEIHQDAALPAQGAARYRQQALALPGWAVLLAGLGWFPGGVIFPACLNAWAGPLPMEDALHFLVSFVLSGLIALTYSYIGVQFVALRVLYPQLWSDPANARDIARQELRTIPGELRLYEFLAILIPIAGACLLIGVGPEQFSLNFRLLVAGLMVFGIAGFLLTRTICNRLSESLAFLIGGGANTSENSSPRQGWPSCA